MKTLRHILSLCMSLVCVCSIAQRPVDYSVSAIATLSSAKFAPYFVSSLRHGKLSQGQSALLDACLYSPVDERKRFSYGFGAEIVGGYTSGVVYSKWSEDKGAWVDNPCRPAPLLLQQLYAEVKYRSIFVYAGMREEGPALLNPTLSSGDFVESGNARPVPQIRGGFRDFVDIPFTDGWVQVQAEVAYGIMADHGYMSSHYNYFNYHITSHSFYNYKRCFFRTDPRRPLSITVGMQSGGFFGGDADYYNNGEFVESEKHKVDALSFFNMLLPVFNHRESFVEGSSLGSWDFYATYSLKSDRKLGAYFQWPFEDGSGVAKRNKIDGLWGLEFKGLASDLVSSVVVEYLDFRDQSGPIHFAPGDLPGSTITSEATGCDNYYNNVFYNSYANYGMSLGTPALLSPIYNLDGSPAFLCNRVNGIHVGVEGSLTPRVHYRALFAHHTGYGTFVWPYSRPRKNTSVSVEANYNLRPNLTVKGQLALDRGKLRGNNFGAMLSISYYGSASNLFRQ